MCFIKIILPTSKLNKTNFNASWHNNIFPEWFSVVVNCQENYYVKIVNIIKKIDVKNI